jgi:NitT/TauT family transport system substrate-binding protein
MIRRHLSWATGDRSCVVGATLLLAGGASPARAQELRLRVGHFPNMTHVQALVGRAFERQSKS